MCEYVISLGFFRSVVSELDKLGLRNVSYLFDWILFDFENVLLLSNNKFEYFLSFDSLG